MKIPQAVLLSACISLLVAPASGAMVTPASFTKVNMGQGGPVRLAHLLGHLEQADGIKAWQAGVFASANLTSDLEGRTVRVGDPIADQFRNHMAAGDCASLSPSTLIALPYSGAGLLSPRRAAEQGLQEAWEQEQEEQVLQKVWDRKHATTGADVVSRSGGIQTGKPLMFNFMRNPGAYNRTQHIIVSCHASLLRVWQLPLRIAIIFLCQSSRDVNVGLDHAW